MFRRCSLSASGLAYTTFKLENLRLEKKTITRGGSTRVFVDVTNTGRRLGTEVAQLYIRDLVSSVTRPVKELKGFEKVRLQPGETKTVTFDITPDVAGVLWPGHELCRRTGRVRDYGWQFLA